MAELLQPVGGVLKEVEPERENGRVAPFLRWIGGKQKLVHELSARLPESVAELDYYEPFLGAGSLYFASAPSRSYLSDSNAHLIGCYEYVSAAPQEVADHLEWHADHNSKSHYYEQRDLYNDSEPSAEQAARFIYLNKTCFNGIFRVNRRGRFNVPWGNKDNPALPSAAQLAHAAALLKCAQLTTQDYRPAIERIGRGSFAYIDPPYPPPTNGTSFALYTSNRFGPQDHADLAEAVSELDRRGGLFMMSNADTPSVRQLYSQFSIEVLPAIRYVTCKNVKYAVNELVITNY